MEDHATGAESPFQNGLCERIHLLVDIMFLKMKEDNPGTPIEILLAWANNSRNSLQMRDGYSSNQLVFGGNPNLPGILTATPSALEGVTTSEVLAKHLNSLHSARKNFIALDAGERLRRALRTKMRSSEDMYVNGD